MSASVLAKSRRYPGRGQERNRSSCVCSSHRPWRRQPLPKAGKLCIPMLHYLGEAVHQKAEPIIEPLPPIDVAQRMPNARKVAVRHSWYI